MASNPTPNKVAEPLLTTVWIKPDVSRYDQVLSFKEPTTARQRCVRLDRRFALTFFAESWIFGPDGRKLWPLVFGLGNNCE